MSSDLVSLRQGIVKTSRNKETAGYTVLLVGQTSVGTSSLVNLITTALLGQSIVTNVLMGTVDYPNQGSRQFHEITSRNGVLVSANINIVECGVRA